MSHEYASTHIWFEAGISGLWTPKITARLAGCEQNCNVCRRLCPTGAIRPLDMEEKKHAKVGTARIIKTRCIVWEQDRTCLICDEICPYNAISNRFVAGHEVIVPVIDENRCNGCGYCENKCPVHGEAAVIVEPLGELRLATESYLEEARKRGLVYRAKGDVEDHFLLDRQGEKEKGEKTGSSGKTIPGGCQKRMDMAGLRLFDNNSKAGGGPEHVHI
ncbi:MAG: 4Fe-4S dicluster domain-containing protein, partial [Deltaproteobacteria bacterium]|nr:4Fe-4S dicluster domain-containing protein [Deltaproteobacteria bacterium]